MGHSRHNKKSRRSKTKEREEELSDIIPMSNDDSINKKKKRSNNQLDDYNDIDDNGDEYTDDYSDDDNDNDNDEVYERSGGRQYESDDEYGNDENDNDYSDDDDDNHSYKAANIKAKRSKPRRSQDFANDGLSELKRDKGVKKLSDKLNNNLHQIQIAIPYGQQDPQRIPGLNTINNNYQLTDTIKPKRKMPFWKKKWFITTLKIIIGLCLLVVCGVFVYKYLKAVEELKQHNQDIFSSGGNGGSTNCNEDADRYKRTLILDNDIDIRNILTDKTYNSLGNTSVSGGGSTNRASTNNSTTQRWGRKLPLRDSRGRFIKSNK